MLWFGNGAAKAAGTATTRATTSTTRRCPSTPASWQGWQSGFWRGKENSPRTAAGLRLFVLLRQAPDSDYPEQCSPAGCEKPALSHANFDTEALSRNLGTGGPPMPGNMLAEFSVKLAVRTATPEPSRGRRGYA